MSKVPTCVGGVITKRRSTESLKNAPRIFSEAAVVGCPLSTIYADPETLPLGHEVSVGNTDILRTRKGGNSARLRIRVSLRS